MRQVEFWRWWVTSEVTGRQVKTLYHMTEKEALARHPGAKRVPGTCEVRDLPETAAERLQFAPGQHFVVQRGRT